MHISFIGLGHMSSAIVAGLLAKGYDPQHICATTRSSASAQDRASTLGVSVVAEAENTQANAQAAARADVVVLGVKPVDILDTARDLAPGLRPETVVVSVAAGTTLAALAEALPAGQPVVRTMPNVALTEGKGVVGMTPGPTVTPEQVQHAKTVFEASGTVFEVPEEQLNALTAVAGSGPGYVFRFVNALAAAGTQLGLNAQTSAELARLTVIGAGAMLDHDDADPAALEASIATEGGVTQAALNSLTDNGFDRLVVQALQANVDRSEQLGA